MPSQDFVNWVNPFLEWVYTLPADQREAARKLRHADAKSAYLAYGRHIGELRDPDTKGPQSLTPGDSYRFQ
jgi:hypothetical protein